MAANDDIKKIYYTIGEVSELLSLNASLIRFWEKEFPVLEPKKSKRGNRMYNEKDIENLRMIHHLLKERGYTIQGARQKIKENRQETLNEAELVARLRYVRSELEKIKSKL